VLLAAVLGVATTWIFFSTAGSPASLLQLPFVLLAIMVVVAFRLPPRWSVTLGAAAMLLAAAAASRGFGPFANDPSAFGRVAALQTYLATAGMLTFILSTVLAEKRRVFDSLTLSEERYRSFVAQSTEAVWRIELEQAMPIGLTLAEQLAWLERHAYLAEYNREFRDLMRRHGADGSESGRWRAAAPWAALLVEHLEEAARRGYSMDGLKLALQTGAHREHWLASVSGVVEEGRLERIWGVARNVTELVVLNERLRRERERLQAYARQLTGAEERARRATAVDLHDGIGQMLVGLGMTLEVAAAQSAPGVRALLEEMRDTVRNIQETTRRVIADLSPPGLYELGLGAALQWLALYMRNKSNLVVNLELKLDERVLNLELRILVFKIVRELLRNIVKHARVDSAVVVVASDLRQLIVDVRDRGVGFEWQLDLFGSGTHGFGLWSIADRVRMAAGELTVETAPGRGCHVRLVFPLDHDAHLHAIEPRAS
jgi:signal transduction histidine kinase